jgi:low temperature requirement protein LtrA
MAARAMSGAGTTSAFGSHAPARASSDVRRPPAAGHQKVTMVELFFDLVFVFAITQLSHALLADLSLANAGRMALLLLAVWWVWIYSVWVTNWLDPDRTRVRLMLFALMGLGLVLAAAIPNAFADRGLAFALAFAAMQVGRTLFVVWTLSGHDAPLARNFARIACWMALSGLFWLAGGFADGSLRIMLWLVALGIEYAAPAAGFWTPHLGRSTTADWNVDPGHMAERCALFVIIALGESLLVTGATFAKAAWTPTVLAAFATAIIGAVAMWWIYFHIGQEEAVERFGAADDPGAVARLAYTYLHLPIIAGVVLAAVGDELVLAHPYGHAEAGMVATTLGGAGLFLVGNLLFKRVTAGRWPLSHLVGLSALVAIWPMSGALWPLAIAVLTAAALVLVAAWEALSLRGRKRPTHASTVEGDPTP